MKVWKRNQQNSRWERNMGTSIGLRLLNLLQAMALFSLNVWMYTGPTYLWIKAWELFLILGALWIYNDIFKHGHWWPQFLNQVCKCPPCSSNPAISCWPKEDKEPPSCLKSVHVLQFKWKPWEKHNWDTNVWPLNKVFEMKTHIFHLEEDKKMLEGYRGQELESKAVHVFDFKPQGWAGWKEEWEKPTTSMKIISPEQGGNWFCFNT